MSFWDRFESQREGVNDTVEFVIRVAIVTLSAVILVVVMALVVGLFLPNEVVDSAAILDMVNPAFQTIIGAFVGLLGGLSLNANARDDQPEELEPEPAPVEPEPVSEEDDGDDLEPWEKYRNDLRYDANGDGVVDENDFPDWRNSGA
jgi:hypothetical protein